MANDGISPTTWGDWSLSSSTNSLTMNTSATTPRRSSGLGMQDDTFMKLLIAQMQSQDPLAPMDSQAMLDQVATLTMLEQLVQMNQNMQSYLGKQPLLEASGMIGKVITADMADGTTLQGTVTGVLQSNGDIALVVQGQNVPLDWVRTVEAPS